MEAILANFLRQHKSHDAWWYFCGENKDSQTIGWWRNISTPEESLLSWNRVGLITEVKIVTDKLEY
jgi:hypothetical protein